MRYRYITANCKPEDQICKFRLISSQSLRQRTTYVGMKYYRVNIPNDLELLKYSSDVYSITEDTRTIEELGYDIIVITWDMKRKVLPKGTDVERFRNKQFAIRREFLYEGRKM